MGAVRDLAWAALQSLPLSFWQALTWLGDSGLLLPGAFSIMVWLLLSRRTWPTARLWALLFGSASLLILVSKLAFLGWCVGSARFNFTGFSGHTALSASVWPVALWLVAAQRSHRFRVVAAIAGWALAAAIGVSRLPLFAHSISEVLGGYVLGFVTSASFLALQRGRPHSRIPGVLVLVGLLAPLLVLRPGTPAPTQGALELIAMRLAGVERVCSREDLLGR
jgi:membrane-associated phospholipid phosphatase